MNQILTKKNLIRLFVNTLVGVLLILLWGKTVDLSQVLSRLSVVNFWVAVPFTLFFALSAALKALRLKILLSDFKITFLNILTLNFFAQLLSFFIPLRLGEVTKGVYLSNQFQMPFTKSLIWVLLDRFIDFWTVLVMALILLTLVPTQLHPNLKVLLPFLVAGLTIGVVVVVYFSKLAKSLADLFSYVFVVPFLRRLFLKLSGFMIETAGFLRKKPGETFLIVALTFSAILVDSCGWFVLFLSLERDTEFVKVLTGSVVQTLTFLVPAAPGYVGSIQAYAVAIYGYGLGFDVVMVSVVAVLMNMLTLFSILIFGVSSLYFLKFDMGQVWKKFKRE